MTPPSLPRALLRSLLPRGVREVLVGDLDEEFEHYIAPGRSRLRAAAWYWWQVLRSLSGALRLRSRARAGSAPTRMNARQWLAQVATDARYGVRRTIQSPSLLATVTLTLALGIAAATSVFTLARAILLQPLRYEAADRLVHISEIDTRRMTSSGNVSYPDFLDYRAQNSTLAAVAGFNGGSRTITGIGEPDRVPMAEVTDGFFALLGVRPALGRDFEPADMHAQSPAVAILTDGAWRRRLGADPAVIGRTITLSGQATMVVGILPRDFEYPLRGLAELWLPMRPSQAQLERRYTHWLEMLGRLKPDVSVDQAAADLTVVARRFASVDPQYHPAARANVVTLSDRMVGRVRPILLVLLGAAGFVLIVACANIAGLLVARGAARVHEVEIRSAIGASRARLVRQLMTESLVLALPGGVLGLVLGQWAVRLFVASIPRAQRAALPHLSTFGSDPAAIVVSLGFIAAAILAFSVLPAWQSARESQRTTLRGRGTTESRRLRLQSCFVVAQLALAVVLLAGSGLMARSVQRLLATSPGFVTEGLLTANINPGGTRYRDPEVIAGFHRELVARVAALPGVTGAGTINQLPLAGPGNSGGFTIAGVPSPADHTVGIRSVSHGYFGVMSIPVVQGRAFTADDRRGTTPVVLVNQLLARTIFEDRPLGQRIVFPFFDGRPVWEIVGVVGDEQFASLDVALRPVVYFPFDQAPSWDFAVVARTTGDAASYAGALRAVAASLDPALPLYGVDTMTHILAESDAVFRRRSVLFLVGGFGIAAVFLAAIGLYGVLAQMVTQRTREIGVRMALGARGGHVARSILTRALVPVAAGLGLGMVATVNLTPTLESLLFEVAARDWATLSVAFAFLTLVAVAATILPARRAVRIDPVVALKQS